jgi:hypothetical protein
MHDVLTLIGFLLYVLRWLGIATLASYPIFYAGTIVLEVKKRNVNKLMQDIIIAAYLCLLSIYLGILVILAILYWN